MRKIKYRISMAMVFAVIVMMGGMVQGARQPRGLDWDALEAASNVVVHGELLVKFKRGGSAIKSYSMNDFNVMADAVHAGIGAQVKNRFSKIGWDEVSLPTGMSLKDAAEFYKNNSDVEMVEPNYILHADAIPNDPRYGELWGMERINAAQAWDITTGSTNIVVAVIDTGINFQHEDLADNIWVNPGESGLDSHGNDKRTNGVDDDGNGYVDDWHGWDFFNNDNDPTDDNGHGTHVSGTIGGVGNNGLGVVGVNWHVKILPLKFLGGCGSGSTADAIKAVEYATALHQYVKLTSNSWGGGGFSQALKDAIAASGAADQLFVAAAGNDGINCDHNPHYPSSYSLPNIISVASIASDGSLSEFSNYGNSSVDIAAPGSDILSCWIGSSNAYNTISGTSMATPHVSGVAALIWAVNPGFTWQEVRDAILNNAVPNPALTGKVATGGELNAFASFPVVIPTSDYYVSGEPDTGPYLPSNKVYRINNYTGSSQLWNVTANEAWLIAPGAVTVPAYGSVEVVVSVDQAVAATLAEGKYSDNISFVNIGTGAGNTSRYVSLRVGYNYKLFSEVYNWIDPVSSGHTKLSLSDGISAIQSIPFNFKYYSTNYTGVYVADSGIAGFVTNALNTYNNNEEMPWHDEPNDIIAPLWDDLTGGAIYVGTSGTAPNRNFIISWINMEHANNMGVRYSFQAIIKEAANIADTNDIVFQYQEVSQDVGTPGEGRSATIGVEDVDGLLGRTYSINGSTLLANRQALLFTMTDVNDVTPPTAKITVLSHKFNSVKFDIRFNEIVTGFNTNDIVLSGSTANITLDDVTVTGSGERYVATVNFGDNIGSVWLGVKGGAVVDLAGLPNPAVDAALYVIPLSKAVFSDSMADGSNDWAVSEGNVGIYFLGGWEWGTPSGWNGPTDGSNCWGTVLDGVYSNNMNSWLESPVIHVTDESILSFDLWYNIESGNDFGYVEVNAGMGWVNVTPGGFYTGDSSGWQYEEIVLDPAVFANVDLKVRFRFTSDNSLTFGGMYVRNFAVKSTFDPGIWAQSITPDNIAVNSSADLTVVAYNMTTTTYHNVKGILGSAVGVNINGNGEISYGTMEPGAITVGAPAISVTAGAADEFVTDTVVMSHLTSTGEGDWFNNELNLGITGGITPPTNTITAKTDTGVVDWLNRPISGNGDDNSSIIQLIYAGTDGTNNPAGADGSATGDDVVLYAQNTLQSGGRFGAGGVPADSGRFFVTFLHNLPAGSAVYARAWAGSEYVTATAYGDSGLRTVSTGSVQTIDFGGWQVGVPVNCMRDSNGDDVPDGWCVLFGSDPDAGQPLMPSWGESSNSMSMLYPEAVAAWSDFLFVADTQNNRIQVWDSDMSTNLYMIGSYGTGVDELNWPAGMVVNGNTKQLIVSDTGNDRIVVYDIDPATGNLTWSFSFGSTGTWYGEFNKPRGVALDNAGNIYVADQANNRIQVFSSTGSYLRSIDDLNAQPVSVAVDASGNIYTLFSAISTVNVYTASGSLLAFFGEEGVGDGQLNNPFDIKIGEGGRIYILDTSNNRISIFDSSYNYLVAYGTFGTAVGELNYPKGFCFSEGGELYVADTRNHRVQCMSNTLDADGDGMDDFWEDANGLDSSNPDDAFADPDGDGLSNIGEYRVGTDPHKRDTNGNGVWDGAEVGMCQDPLAPFDGVVINNVWIGGRHALSWNGDSGAVYDIEMSTNLINTNWTVKGTVSAAIDGTIGWTNSVVEPGRLHYYRVIRK